jgi:secreted trypsin-like serine protease
MNIETRFTFSAAHCLYANLERYATAQEVRVSVGSSYRDARLGLTYSVLRLIRHPKYFLTYERIENDLAIVRLMFPLIFTRVIQPIPIGKFTINAGDMVMVTGKRRKLL